MDIRRWITTSKDMTSIDIQVLSLADIEAIARRILVMCSQKPLVMARLNVTRVSDSQFDNWPGAGSNEIARLGCSNTCPSFELA